ncbi:DUF4424 domain-containing protein [Xanthomonas campestris pv. phormiicola]|nr:DUF4424 domain-containing protein [Xanthomonas campestris pv. phormiicola]
MEHLRYIQLTGNNWKGPIQDFHLTLKKRGPADLVSPCFDGALKRTGPLTFEFGRKDFVPKQDLNVLFLR